MEHFRHGFDESRGLASGKRQKSMLDLRTGPLVAGLGTKSGHRQSMVDLRHPPDPGSSDSDPRQRFSLASDLPPHLRHYLVSEGCETGTMTSDKVTFVRCHPSA